MELNIKRVENEVDVEGNEKRVLLIVDKNTKNIENLYMGIKPFITEYDKKIRKH